MPRMYVLVRKDLSEVYKCVQGTHAVVKFSTQFPTMFLQWNNGYLIFLGVQNLKKLKEWQVVLEQHTKPFVVYREPDLDDQMTAIACYDTGEIFGSLKSA